ncbi:MAG: type II toxin-antitoxin system VapC family toxin [Acidobacteria bacterium]|nr:type II toxin-antitoxin system VapC family toxin [Acidobacteriota bacterium]
MILDTNALSAVADEDPEIEPALRDAEFLALPVIALGEYRQGIGKSRYREEYEAWLNGLVSECRVIEITEPTTEFYANVQNELRETGKPIPTNDIWIAALCRQYKLPLLSRDRHFDFVRGIRRIEW